MVTVLRASYTKSKNSDTASRFSGPPRLNFSTNSSGTPNAGPNSITARERKRSAWKYESPTGTSFTFMFGLFAIAPNAMIDTPALKGRRSVRSWLMPSPNQQAEPRNRTGYTDLPEKFRCISHQLVAGKQDGMLRSD